MRGRKRATVCGLIASTLVLGGAVIEARGPGGKTPAAVRLSSTPQWERYDDFFRKYTKRYFGPAFDWRFFKAQAIVESNLRPDAVSPVGARGMMQVMPATYAEIRRANSEFGDINDAEWNIAAGIAYARDQWVYFKKEADDAFQRHFMLGSYNAGRGTMMRAQKVAVAEKLNPRLWPSIEQIAATVGSWRYSETLPYVAAVFTNLEVMDRQGRPGGATVSKQDSSGASLEDQVKKVKALRQIGDGAKSVFGRLKNKFNN